MKMKIAVAICIILSILTSSLPIITVGATGASCSGGFWRFDEGTGSFAYDSTGNDNTATIAGAIWTNGKLDNALEFDGVDDYVEVADANSLDITGKITIEAWIYPHSYLGSQVIVSKYNHSSLSSSFYLSLGTTGYSDRIYFALTYNGNNYYALVSNAVIPLNTWTHVVAVSNTTYMIIYINGVVDKTRTYPPATVYAGTANLRIGCYLPEFGYARYFDGVIDEVRVAAGVIWTVDDDGAQCPSASFTSIQAAVNAASSEDTIIVHDGTYQEALYINKDLTIKAASTPVVNGSQLFATDFGNREAVIFVENAANVILDGLDVEGSGLGPVKNYGVVFENSGGTVKRCIVSPNTIGDMQSTGIAAWSNSSLHVEDCTVHNFGRIGIYANNATMAIVNNVVVGQVYNLDNQVNYGIEIEDYSGPSIADITGNEIFNCNNTHPSPLWSSGAIIVDTWREWADYYNLALLPSKVSITYNTIHDNYEAIEIVSNQFSYAHYNDFYSNIYGVWSAPENWTTNPTYYIFDACYNWWGDASGPLHETSWLYLGEPYGPHFGAGNDVGDYVLYYPWLGEPSGEPVEPPTASFTYTPPGPKAGELATLDASSSTANGGTITEYEWNFGDGNTTTTSDPVIKHAFGSAATYNVTLTITDSEGLTDSTWQSVTVVPATVPVYAYMKVEPPIYHTKKRGTIFTINVTLYNITESMQLVAVEFKLRYNTTLLRAINATEGPFLSSYGGSPHQGTYFTYVIHSDYVHVGVVFMPDEHGAYHFFPSGNGTVATITFEAIYQPMGLEKPDSTCNLQLFDTKLADSLGIPPGIPHNKQNGSYSIGPTPWGDVNYDGIVDIFDITAVAIIFGSEPDNPNWNADADLNGDKIIDIFDIVTVALHLGEEDP